MRFATPVSLIHPATLPALLLATLFAFSNAWAAPVALTFQEKMRGATWIQGQRIPLQVKLQARIDDLDRWEQDPQHPAHLTGLCLLEGRPIRVEGALGLMVRASEPDTRGYRLEYQWASLPGEILELEFVGFKQIRKDSKTGLKAGFDLYSNVTTLNGHFLKLKSSEAGSGTPVPEAPAGDPLPRVQLRFTAENPITLASFLASIQVEGVSGVEATRAKERFFRVWFDGILDEYFKRHLTSSVTSSADR